MRLEDIDYNNQRLDGVPEPPGQLPPVEHYQGEDVVFEVLLQYIGKPVTLDAWNINLIVKKNAFAKTVVWSGGINDGLYQIDNIPGYYRIIIPSTTTSTLIAGTYWLDAFIHEKIGVGDGLKDLSFVVLHQPFSIDYTAASPTPPVLMQDKIQEQTYPPPIDATKF